MNKIGLRFSLLLLVSLSFLFSESILQKDKKITILYICGIEGRFAFDNDGRKGLTTISELKRLELEKNFYERGSVLLLSSGNFFQKENFTESWHIIKKAGFDAVFLGEEEISYLEKNPNLLKLNLPILSTRENLASIDTEKIFQLDGINIKVTNYLVNKLPYEVKIPIHLNLVFPEPNKEQDLQEIHPEIPVIFFLNANKTTAYSFHRNVYTAECPNSMEKIGKLTLTYRNQKLIRQIQEFIPLNTKDHNQKWIFPLQQLNYSPTLLNKN